MNSEQNTIDRQSIESLDGSWRMEQNKKEKKFNKLREKFVNDVARYYRSSAYGSRTYELELSNQLRELHALREELIDFSRSNSSNKSTIQHSDDRHGLCRYNMILGFSSGI